MVKTITNRGNTRAGDSWLNARVQVQHADVEVWERLHFQFLNGHKKDFSFDWENSTF